MKQIIVIFKKIFTTPITYKNIKNINFINIKPNPLGRWNVKNSDETINLKIDLANEDNCGPCGQYSVINKNNK